MHRHIEEYKSGSTEPWTVDILTALVRAKKPMVLLETGTYKGLTTMELKQAMPFKATLHTVDTCESGDYSKFIKDVPGIEFHKMDALEWIKKYNGPPIEFAFIDDKHEPVHVNQELIALKPKMARHGLITLHDVFGHFKLAGVVVGQHGYCIELPLLHAGGGLGLIQIPA